MIGPCAKQRVTCTLVHPDGRRWVGENACANAQPTCPRAGMATGQGYELCASVCQQLGHAEVVALGRAGRDARSCTAYVEGHTYACDPCRRALYVAGVHDVVIGAPP